MSGWPARRRRSSAPVYPDPPTTAARYAIVAVYTRLHTYANLTGGQFVSECRRSGRSGRYPPAIPIDLAGIGPRSQMRLRFAAVVVVVAVALSACQFGNPEPATHAAHVGSPHRTLLMIGDSLMGQHDVAFPGVLAAHGVVATVIDAHVNASGLIGP